MLTFIFKSTILIAMLGAQALALPFSYSSPSLALLSRQANDIGSGGSSTPGVQQTGSDGGAGSGSDSTPTNSLSDTLSNLIGSINRRSLTERQNFSTSSESESGNTIGQASDTTASIDQVDDTTATAPAESFSTSPDTTDAVNSLVAALLGALNGGGN